MCQRAGSSLEVASRCRPAGSHVPHAKTAFVKDGMPAEFRLDELPCHHPSFLLDLPRPLYKVSPRAASLDMLPGEFYADDAPFRPLVIFIFLRPSYP